MTEHISVRTVWHDDGWGDRHVSNAIKTTKSAKNKNAKKDDKNDWACPVCGGHNTCLRESGCFMLGKSDAMRAEHPYAKQEILKGIETTQQIFPPYSLVARPFRWMLKEAKSAQEIKEGAAGALAEDAPIGYQQSLEEELVRALNYKTPWITHGVNQKRIFEYFYRHLEPHKSLIFPYAKRCSLTDTAGRVLIGIGHVAGVGALQMYKGAEKNEVEPYLWERPIQHTIRETREDGFLLPFEGIKEYLERHPDANPDDFLVIIPFEYQLAFSYATEKVPTDAVLWVLNRLREVVKLYQACRIGGEWAGVMEWLEKLYTEVSAEQTEYPGLGALFTAKKFKYGADLAEYIAARAMEKGKDLWEIATEVLTHPKDYIVDETTKIMLSAVTQTQGLAWAHFYKENREYVEFVTRFELAAPQMEVALKLAGHAQMVMDDPYLLYELTRLFDERQRIRLQQLDYTIFSARFPERFAITEPDNPYRLRAILVYCLEKAAAEGSELYSQDDFLAAMRSLRPDLDFPLPDGDTLAALGEYFRPEVAEVTLKEKAVGDESDNDGARVDGEVGEGVDGSAGEGAGGKAGEREKIYFKLQRLQKFDDAIVGAVEQRLKGAIALEEDWGKYLKDYPTEELKKQTVGILENLARRRLSVLTGGAGTGKTSTIAQFCQSPAVHKNGILVLAPTGKARVVLAKKLKEEQVPADAKTVAQFLLTQKCWQPRTGQYIISDEVHNDLAAYGTVIVDECSMLTIEMMGALMQVLRPVQRVILLGDPNQLPPIGAGKPFYDLVQYLREQHPEDYNELTHIWRQDGAGRADVRLAHQFVDGAEADEELTLAVNGGVATRDLDLAEGSDSATGGLALAEGSSLAAQEHLEFVHYDELAELPEKIIELVTKVTGMKDADDVESFDTAIGGVTTTGREGKTWMNFPDFGAVKAESWQIVSPFKNKEIVGARAINQLIHERYRNPNTAGERNHARTPRPLGDEKIVLGDKVINTENRRHEAYPRQGAANYLANGEIGVVSAVKGPYLNVIYASQPGYYYGEVASTSGDLDAKLELAYALTAHKVQGSTYNNTIVVLYDSADDVRSRFVSRELIYTALTRQADKVYILYNREPSALLKYRGASALAERLTNLFTNPAVLVQEHRKYDENLIHVARGGLEVRSKSELVIADLLYETKSELPYFYEKPLVLGDVTVHPDFTLVLPDGREVYWEHLGMLNNPDYARGWEAKKALYAKNGISEEQKNLIVTRDDERGGLNAEEIAARVHDLLHLGANKLCI